MAGRQGLRAHLQPDGRCRHGGNFRAQVWQWLKYSATLADGRKITPQLYEELLPQELARIEKEIGTARFNAGHFPQATKLFTEMSRSPSFVEFLTLPAYNFLD